MQLERLSSYISPTTLFLKHFLLQPEIESCSKLAEQLKDKKYAHYLDSGNRLLPKLNTTLKFKKKNY